MQEKERKRHRQTMSMYNHLPAIETEDFRNGGSGGRIQHLYMLNVVCVSCLHYRSIIHMGIMCVMKTAHK